VAGSVTFKKGAKVEGWERNLDNPKRVLKQIGILLVGAAQEAFEDQAFNGRAWDARAVPNVYGILADLDAGKKPPARRFEDRPALIDTGRLRSSIAFRTLGTHTVEVGTNVDYGDVHQKGGPIESAPINRQRVWAWLKEQSKDLRKELGWLVNEKFDGDTLKGEVEARPFLGITKQLRKDVLRWVGVSIVEVK